MNTPRESVRDARAKLREIAGRTLAHKEEAAAALAAAEKARAAATEGSPEAALLDEDVARKRTAAEEADRDHAAVLAQMDGLVSVGKEGERAAQMAAVRVAKPGDPLSDALVDQALARAREGIREAENRVALDRELNPSAAAAAPAETPEEKAKRQLAELKAARKKG
ncbi:MAG: hypothetical protein HY904_13050 [Deltaproteobacteria bacterium]|nr:hypothetical protein [Deltaproteobacteria bacterium]